MQHHPSYRAIVLLFLLAAGIPSVITGQQKDSLDLLRLFMNAARTYQQVPLQVNMDLRNHTNLVLAKEDTSHIQAEFYRDDTGGYIKLGEMEQIVNDSMALIVSNELKRMIIYKDAQAVAAQMRSMMAPSLPDSSILRLAARYTVTAEKVSDRIGQLNLFSRMKLPGTTLSGEEMAMDYQQAPLQPVKIRMLKRSLIPVQPEDSVAATKQYGQAGQLIHIEGEGLFIIREQVSEFVFTKITHDKSVRIPVLITDRIMKNEEGNYIPTKDYASFLMTQNF